MHHHLLCAMQQKQTTRMQENTHISTKILRKL